MSDPTNRPPPGTAPGTPALPDLARGGLLNLAGAGVAGLSGVGVAWLAARGLGPAGAGVLFTAMATFTLVAGLAKLGSPTGLVYWVARLRALDRADDLAACLRAALGPVAVAALVLACGLWLAAPWLAALLAGSHRAAATGALRATALFLPAAALADALLATTRGHHLMRPTVVLDRSLRSGLQLAGAAALTVVALWTAPSPAAWSLAWAARTAPVAALAGYAAFAATRAATPTPALRVAGAPGRTPAGNRTAAAFWRFTAPRALAGTAQVALQRVDVLLVAALAGPAPAAVYTIAGRFLVLGQLVNQSVGDALAPRLAAALSVDDRAGAGALYRAATNWLVLATWPLHLLALGYAPLYLRLFGEPYREGSAVVVVLAATMLLATGCGPVDVLLTMAGRTGWNLGNVSLALALMVGVDALLVPRSGALGAAVGLAAAIAVRNLLPLLQVGLALRLHPFGRATATAAGLAVGCFGVLPAAVTAVAGTGPVALAAALTLGAGGYLVGVRRFAAPLALPVPAPPTRFSPRRRGGRRTPEHHRPREDDHAHPAPDQSRESDDDPLGPVRPVTG